MKTILISGAGIAGPTLAWWLLKYGFDVTIVERAGKLRSSGYIIDFWGAGYEVASRMGVLPQIREAGYVVRELKVVNRAGRKVASFPAGNFARAANGQYTSLGRGDLAAILFHSVEGRCKAIFGDSISGIRQTGPCVNVTFENGGEHEFDLVIGADGLHSRVRTLAFGPEEHFETYLGFKVAGFAAHGYHPRDELTYVMYNEPDVQIARFAMRDDITMFLLIYRDPAPDQPHTLDAQKALLRERFGPCSWETPQILDAMDGAEELYFDRVSQINMTSNPGLWSKGRITLVGDAAAAPSFLAGQGSALAMIAAYLLAGELHRCKGDFSQAFAQYQSLFGPFVRNKQKAAIGLAGTFAPRTGVGIWIRNTMINLMNIPWVTDFIVGRGIIDKIELPAY